MDGITVDRRLLEFCVAQDAIFVMFGLLSLFLVGDVLTTDAPSDRIFILAVLATLIAVLTALFIVWHMLKLPIDLIWDIPAKARIKDYMMRGIILGGALAVASFLLVAIFGIPSGALGWGIGVSILLAAAMPFGASLRLTVTALKRYLVKRNSVNAISNALDDHRSPQMKDFERVRASLATELGNGSTSVRPSPPGFTFAGLSSKPWHDPADFPWISAFEEAAADIRDEALKVLGQHQNTIETYKYPGLDGDHWRAFRFVSQYHENDENIQLCPVTAGLLKTIPGYPHLRDALFSILEPNGEIGTHRDWSNIFLTMHLGLVTPGNGFLEVAGIRREWVKDRAIVFDSSYEHRAVNQSDRVRIVLLVDFMHPDITDEERKWIYVSKPEYIGLK